MVSYQSNYLKVLEDRMYLYFCGKNLNTIKYNTRKMVVINRLNFFIKNKGIDYKLLGKINRRKKKSKQFLLYFNKRVYGDGVGGFTERQKWKFVNRIFRNFKKTPLAYNISFILNENEMDLEVHKRVLILNWYSEKALLKKVLATLNIDFEHYLNYKVVFAIRVEFHYWSKKNAELHVEAYLENNRVRFIVILPSIYKIPIYKKRYKNFKKTFKKIINYIFYKEFKSLEDEEIERSIFWLKSWVMTPEGPVWQ